MRTDRGALTLLPQRQARGYGLAGAGGRGALAEYIQQLADSDGQDTFVGGSRRAGRPAPQIEEFLERLDGRRPRPLTLADLQELAGT